MGLLERFDQDERYAAEFPGLRREVTDTVVRHVDRIGHAGVVIHSQLSDATADTAIGEQIAYFGTLGQEFEWKVYGYDAPPDLTARLVAHGFDIDEPETVMVIDLAVSQIPTAAADQRIAVRRIERPGELREVAAVKERVYGDAADLSRRLTFELASAPRYLSVYIAELDGTPAATAWIRFPENSAFASLWGGSTLPEHRNQGLYTALLAARLAEASARGIRYVTVDARAMSRPILEKRGFRVLTFATACTWHG